MNEEKSYRTAVQQTYSWRRDLLAVPSYLGVILANLFYFVHHKWLMFPGVLVIMCMNCLLLNRIAGRGPLLEHWKTLVIYEVLQLAFWIGIFLFLDVLGKMAAG